MIMPKKSKKLLIVGLILAGALVSLPFFKVFAQDFILTDQQILVIRENCISSKNTLNQLHVSDALLRVNMGQAYESMSTKLMDRFNSRISYNSLDNSNLVAASKNYVINLDKFRLDYKDYEEKLSLALDIDCVKQPVNFYDAVLVAQSGRDLVHADVLLLNQDIDKYQLALDEFEKNYQSIAEEAKK